jgi:hypothetical protein
MALCSYNTDWLERSKVEMVDTGNMSSLTSKISLFRVGSRLKKIDAYKGSTYKVVQIWPGLIVCKQVTVCPGHIWTTLYITNCFETRDNFGFAFKEQGLFHFILWERKLRDCYMMCCYHNVCILIFMQQYRLRPAENFINILYTQQQ